LFRSQNTKPAELATCENTAFRVHPIIRIVPTTIVKTTDMMTAYSATSWPSSDQRTSKKVMDIRSINKPRLLKSSRRRLNFQTVPGNGTADQEEWHGRGKCNVLPLT